MEQQEKDYSLKDSIAKVGPLYPILEDAYGNIIDGFHRKEEYPDWPVQKVEHITDPVQLAIARLIANICRREVPAEEKTEWLRQIAQMTGWTPKQIAEKLPVSYTWVMKYLPDEFKERPGQGPIEYPVTRRVTETSVPSQDTSLPKPQAAEQPEECGNCHVRTWFPIKLRDGNTICTLCLDRLLEQQKISKDDLLKEGETPTAKPKAEPKPEIKVYKPKETWEHRKAIMSPQHSRMEETILEKLYEKDVKPVVVDREFCIKSTTPDFYFPSKNLVVYLDGPVHEGKQDRDEQLRDALTKRHGLKVISIPYTNFSQQEADRILEEITKEAV